MERAVRAAFLLRAAGGAFVVLTEGVRCRGQGQHDGPEREAMVAFYAAPEPQLCDDAAAITRLRSRSIDT